MYQSLPLAALLSYFPVLMKTFRLFVFLALPLLWVNWLFSQNVIAPQTSPRSWADTLLAQQLIKESKQLTTDDHNEAALEKARQALVIYTDLYGEEHVQTAIAAMYVARGIRNFRRDEEAVIIFQHSLRVFEAAHDTIRMALCHNLICSCRRNQSKLADALQHIQTAIALIRGDSTRNASLLANFKITLAYIYDEQKNYFAAIPLLEEAKAVHTLNKNAYALGLTSYHLGEAYFGLHDFVRAKENYLTAWAHLKPGLIPSHSYFADLLVQIGLCCQKTGASKLGLHYLMAARAAYLELGLDDVRYIGFLQTLGRFYLVEKQYPAAIEQFEACLTAKEKLFGTQSYYLYPTLRLLGEAYMYSGQFIQAEACNRRGLQIEVSLPRYDQKPTSLFYSDLAAVRLAQGDFAGSLLLCDTAFSVIHFDPAQPEKVLPRDFFRELCQRYAAALTQQFQQTGDRTALVKAEHFLALAAETLHLEMAEVTVNSSREILYDHDHLVLDDWLDASMMLFKTTAKPEHAETAFQIAGSSKAFLLAEAMRQNGALRYAGVPDSILQTEWSLREHISAAEKKLDAVSNFPAAHLDSTTLLLSRDMSGWRSQYDALLRRIETNYPNYFRLRQLRHDIPTIELRQKWLAPDQSLLMYSLTDFHVYIFVLTRDTFLTVTLPLDAALHGEVDILRKSLTEYFAASEPDDALYDQGIESYIAAAQSLYRKLVLPVAPWLSGRVVVIPEGALCYLPFEALLTGAPTETGNFRTYPFWIREKAISYALSTEYLVETASPPPLKFKKTWLGVAPFHNNQAFSQADGLTSRQEKFALLPFSGKEVTTIAGLLHGETWLGAAARPGRFEKEAAQYRILHLATHSRADDRSGHYSYIATSNTGEPLIAKNLYLLSLSAEMVALSSCEAGGGELLRGEGIIGLVRAFTFAGARSIVAPLWYTNDQSTASLMVNYYQNLRRGQPKDVALQKACINLVNSAPTESHPFFWAGFRVFGRVAPLW